MTGANRAAHVRKEMEELGQQIRHLPGGAAVFASPLVTEITALIALVDSLAGPARTISARHEALWRLLKRSAVAPGATNMALDRLGDLAFQHDVDPETAAEALGMKTDTVRKYLRSGIIQGHKVGPKWRVPLSAVEDYHRKAA